MRRTLRSIVVATAVTLAMAAPASAHGVSPAQLGDQGWQCAFVLGAVHCFPPGTGSTTATINALVFTTDDPEATEAPFVGTEHLIRADLFQGQPCPRDPPSRQYTDLMPLLGIPYFACHRYDSSF
jgi:hypothetical protein